MRNIRSTRIVLKLAVNIFILVATSLLEWGFVFNNLFNSRSTLLLFCALATAIIWALLNYFVVKNINRYYKELS